MRDCDLSILFYTMANLNLIDGSSIWMHSVAETLHVDHRLQVTIPLRTPERRDVVTRALRRLERVELVDPRELGGRDPGGMSVVDSVTALERLDAKRRHDIVLLRAYDLCLEAVRRGRFSGRLWSCYILEPERDIADPAYLAGMTRIAEASRHVVCQSEEMRALLESLVPAAIGKTIILAPAIPVDTVPRPDPGRIVRRLIYAGKFHRFYPVDKMIDAFERLRTDHPDLEFHVAGDKFHRPKGDAAYAAALERRLMDTPGLVWHGGIGRDEVEALLARGGIALSLWDFRHGPGMNNLVISTKLLDFCSVGLPAILSRTAAQEEVLGPDYPLFVTAVDEALPLLRRLLVDPALYREAAERCFASSRPFTYPAVYAGIAPYIDRAAEERPVPSAGRRRIIVVADGPSEVEALLGPLARFDIDRSAPPGGRTAVVVYEGGGGRAGHRAPATGDRRVRILRLAVDGDDAVGPGEFDRVVVTSPALGRAVAAESGLPADRVIVIPRPIDDAQLARPKLAEAMFNVAVAGVPDERQRSILAALLARLRAADERFRLVIRDASATDDGARREGSWVVGPGGEDDELEWEPDDGDPVSWYRTVGFVVATDPDEAQARAMAEAMASAAVAIVVGPLGAAADWLVDEGAPLGPAEAAERIMRLVRDGTRDDEGASACDRARAAAGLAAVRAAWTRVIE